MYGDAFQCFAKTDVNTDRIANFGCDTRLVFYL